MNNPDFFEQYGSYSKDFEHGTDINYLTFNSLVGIAKDNNERIWICDTGNNRILIFSDNTLSDYQIVDDSILAPSPLKTCWNMPFRVYAHPSQNKMFISDMGNHRIVVLTYDSGASPSYYKEFGSHGIMENDKFNAVNGLCVVKDGNDEEYLIAAEEFSDQGPSLSCFGRLHRIKLNDYTAIDCINDVTLSGLSVSGVKTLIWPQGIDSYEDNIYFTLPTYNAIGRCDFQGNEVKFSATGKAYIKDDSFSVVRGVKVLQIRESSGAANDVPVIAIADNGGGKVFFYGLDGLKKDYEITGLSGPIDICSSKSGSGKVLVTEAGGQKVREYDIQMQCFSLTEAGQQRAFSNSSGESQFNGVQATFMSSPGPLEVFNNDYENYNNRFQRWKYNPQKKSFEYEDKWQDIFSVVFPSNAIPYQLDKRNQLIFIPDPILNTLVIFSYESENRDYSFQLLNYLSELDFKDSPIDLNTYSPNGVAVIKDPDDDSFLRIYVALTVTTPEHSVDYCIKIYRYSYNLPFSHPLPLDSTIESTITASGLKEKIPSLYTNVCIRDICVGKKGDDLYLFVADMGNNTIIMTDIPSHEKAKNWGITGYDKNRLCLPTGLCSTDDYVFVVDLVNRSMKVLEFSDIDNSNPLELAAFFPKENTDTTYPQALGNCGEGFQWYPRCIGVNKGHGKYNVYVTDLTLNIVNSYKFCPKDIRPKKREEKSEEHIMNISKHLSGFHQRRHIHKKEKLYDNADFKSLKKELLDNIASLTRSDSKKLSKADKQNVEGKIKNLKKELTNKFSAFLNHHHHGYF